MLDAKIHINSTISDAHKGARHLGLNITNYYLGTPMDNYTSTCASPPQSSLKKSATIQATTSRSQATGTYISKFVEVCTASRKPGLLLSINSSRNWPPMAMHLCHSLQAFGITKPDAPPSPCVDNFGFKYFSRADAQHLINALQADYSLTIDLSGSLFCDLTLDWHYNEG